MDEAIEISHFGLVIRESASEVQYRSPLMSSTVAGPMRD
jgi:hypothetical protein